jgi:hypothetical protein
MAIYKRNSQRFRQTLENRTPRKGAGTASTTCLTDDNHLMYVCITRMKIL